MLETEGNEEDEVEDTCHDETDEGTDWDNRDSSSEREDNSHDHPGELVDVDHEPDSEDPCRDKDGTTGKGGGVSNTVVEEKF